MAAPSPQSDEQVQALNDTLAQDPEFRRLMQARNASRNSRTKAGVLGASPEQAALRDYLLSKGIDLGQLGLTTNAQGQIVRDHFLRDVALWTGVVGGGAAALGAAGGAAPVAGTGASAGTGSAVGGAGAGAGVAASTPLWKDLLKVGIPVGAQIGADIYNTKTQADANKAAVDAQAKAAADALAFTKEQYADLQRRRAPFEAASLGSLTELYKRMGLGDLPSQTHVDPNAPGNPTGNPTLNPSPITPTPTPYITFPYEGTTPVGNNQGPPVVDASGRRIYVPPNPNVPKAVMPPMGTSLNSLNGGPTNTTAMVRMRAPDGSVGNVPADKVTQATAAGGVVVG